MGHGKDRLGLEPPTFPGLEGDVDHGWVELAKQNGESLKGGVGDVAQGAEAPLD